MSFTERKAINITRMWLSSHTCKSSPRKTEFENALLIALGRWEWGSPKAYCSHLKATNLEQPIKRYWNLSPACANRRTLLPIQSRERCMAENVLKYLHDKRVMVSPLYPEVTGPE